MRHGTAIVLFTCSAGVISPQLVANGQRSATADIQALRFFASLPQTDRDTTLRVLRPQPAGVAERARARARLPPKGALTPTAAEATKLDALRAVLAYHGREQVFDVKVVDVPQALVGLYDRAILLISRPALSLLSAAEIQAVGAHEVGHDFFWGELEQARQRHDWQARQQLELQCDGIAALTLVALHLPPARLVEAVRKLIRFNEKFGAAADDDGYPNVGVRQAFVSALVARRGR
jgi:hypothetical protein